MSRTLLKPPVLFTIYSHNSVSIRRFLLVADQLCQMGRPAAFLDYTNSLHDAIECHALGLKIRHLPDYHPFSAYQNGSLDNQGLKCNILSQFPRVDSLPMASHADEIPPLIQLLRVAGIDPQPLLNRMVVDNLQGFFKEISSAELLLRSRNPGCIVYDIETPKRTRALLYTARHLSIPIVSMQHGEGNCEQYDKLPLMSDFYVAYSPYNFNKLKEMGVSKERIFLTGAPETDLLLGYEPKAIRQEFHTQFRLSMDKELILIALKPNNSSAFCRFNEQLLSMIEATFDGGSNHEIVVKQHPTDLQQIEYDYLAGFRSQYPNMIFIPGDYVISKLLAVSRYFITFLSSALVEAVIQNNYTIVVEKDNHVRWPDWNMFGVYDAVSFESLPAILSRIYSGRYENEMAHSKRNRQEFAYYYRFKMDGKNTFRVAMALEGVAGGQLSNAQSDGIQMHTHSSPNTSYAVGEERQGCIDW